MVEGMVSGQCQQRPWNPAESQSLDEETGVLDNENNNVGPFRQQAMGRFRKLSEWYKWNSTLEKNHETERKLSSHHIIASGFVPQLKENMPQWMIFSSWTSFLSAHSFLQSASLLTSSQFQVQEAIRGGRPVCTGWEFGLIIPQEKMEPKWSVGEHRRMSGKFHLPWHKFPVSHSGQVQTSTITLLYQGLDPALPEWNPMDHRGFSVHVPAPGTPELPDSWGKAFSFISKIPTIWLECSKGLQGVVGTQVTWHMKRAGRFGYFSWKVVRRLLKWTVLSQWRTERQRALLLRILLH